MASGFAFVNVVRERVSPQATVKALRGHLRHSGRSSSRIVGSGDGTRTTVSGNSKHGRQGTWLEIFQQRGNNELRRSRIASGVRDSL